MLKSLRKDSSCVEAVGLGWRAQPGMAVPRCGEMQHN